MSVQELALKTIAEIERRGWMQDDFYDSEHEPTQFGPEHDAYLTDCHVCLVGGIRAAITGKPTAPNWGSERDSYDALTDALAGAIDADWFEDGRHSSSRAVLYDFNDEPGRTKGEVLALLHRVAQQ